MAPGKGCWHALTDKLSGHVDEELKLVKVEIRHRIENFRAARRLNRINEEIFISRVFSSSLAPDFLWQLVVVPNSSRGGSEFYLRLTGPAAKKKISFNVTFTIALKEMNNRFGYIICDNATEEFSSGQYALGRRDVKHSDLESLIHPDGSLFVLANLEFYADVLASRCKNKPSCSGETNYKLEVIDSYARLLKSGMMSDLTIVVGRAKLRVHQCVLAVRSPYFEALFASDHNSGYSEVKNGVLKIDDFAKQPVEGMLSFIYTGEIDDAIVNKCGESLLQLADKYQMDEMKSYMEGKMAASLRVETFVPVALLADSHRCHFLKEACVTFLRNNFDSITSDDVWKELKSGNRASVAAELLEMAHPGR